MSDVHVPLIDLEAIRRVVDSGSYSRGVQYERYGNVLTLDWDPDSGRLLATVRGSERQPYTSTAWVGGDPMGSVITANACSCPLGGSCKHVVASLLALRLHTSADPLPGLSAPTQPTPVRAAGSTRSRPTPSPLRPARPKPPAWKSALSPLLRSDGPPEQAYTEAETVRLGLQFRVDGLKQILDPASRSMRSSVPVRVQIRPVQQGKKGGWSGGYGVGWMPGFYGRSSFDPRASAWVQELGQLWRGPGMGSAGGYGYGYSYNSSAEWRTLEDFSPVGVWQLLAQAAELEVPLIGNGARDSVELVAQADIALEATATQDGGMVLRQRLALDGTPVTYDLCGAAGSAGLFAVQLDGKVSRLLIGPSSARLSDADRALLAMTEDAVVPPAELDDFLDGTLPRLRRQVSVRSFDGSVTLPEPPQPRLLVSIAVPEPSVLHLRWQWLYGTARRALHTVDAVRDLAAEVLVRRRVEAAVGEDYQLAEYDELAGDTAIAFIRDVLPVLEASDDVVVEADELPDYREISEAPTVSVSAGDSDDPDWFDLGIRVTVEEREVPFTPLFAALARGDEYLVLDDGSYLRTDLPALEQLRTLIEEARRLQDRPGPLRLNRYAAGLWGDLADLADVVEQSDRWRESVGALAAISAEHAAPVEVAVPDGLTATLRPYQKQAYDWLVFLHQHGLGGILADDMGLGKTVEVLALLEHVRASRTDAESSTHQPFLVVAPASVIANWGLEATRFTPGLRTVVLPSTLGKLGLSLSELVAGVDVVITSYAIFRLDFDELSSIEWAGLIMDEAQFLKNPKTKANEYARLLRAPMKLAVTGTPLENNLLELWAMLAVVAPGLYGSPTRFREDYVRTVSDGLRARQTLDHDRAGHLVGYGDEDRALDEEVARAGNATLVRLRRRIRPLLLRRTKEQVAPDLPERVEQELSVELVPKHRRAYDLLLQRERQRVLRLLDEDFEGNRFTIFRSLTLLRRAALDISLTDPDRHPNVPSAKIDVLFEQLEEVVAAGHRALVFSQFTTFLAKIAERADHEGIDYAYLDGATRQRARVIEEFKTGDAPLFLISLKAGGFGLNLTEADYVFMMDPWWNPASENQAIDRTHRIGQDRTVMVFRLISAGTIEEKVMALKARKAQLFNAVLDDDEGAFAGSLGPDDIRGLFGD